MKGTVIQSTGKWYEVKLDSGAVIPCRIKGRFRLDDLKTTNPVAVGDAVEVQQEDTDQTGTITAILPRKNYIIRQSPKRKSARHIIAANIDQAILMATFSQPRTSTGFIDRFLLTAEVYHIPVVLLFNKADLYAPEEMKTYNKTVELYEKIGYPSLLISAKQETLVEALRPLLKGKTSLLAGHSGVGKSTLLNALHPVLELKTAPVSAYTGKGKHATTFAEMHTLPFGGHIIDTPGIKEFGIIYMDPADVSDFFREMKPLQGDCKFNNCLHLNEPGCVIRQAVEAGEVTRSRYDSYVRILEELRQANFWEQD